MGSVNIYGLVVNLRTRYGNEENRRDALVIVIHKLRLYPRPHGKLDCESVHRTEIREVTPNQANTVRGYDVWSPARLRLRQAPYRYYFWSPARLRLRQAPY